MAQFIQVVESENDDITEIPSEMDGTLLLATVSAQFPGACGLKYRNPETGAFRGVRLLDGIFHPPDVNTMWGSHIYICVFPKVDKRKSDAGDEMQAKQRKLGKSCSDLIILGLPFRSSEDEVRTYFKQFGDLEFVQIKKDRNTGKSKGFGFVRFTDIESQQKCTQTARHMIDGRWCDVLVPTAKQNSQRGYDFSGSRGYGYQEQPVVSNKIFVGRVPEDFTVSDLRDHFSQYGEIIDVYIPKPYRAFAFVTFASTDSAMSIGEDDHIIKGQSVHVSIASPRPNKERENRGGGGSGFGNRNRNDSNSYNNNNNANGGDFSANPFTAMLAAAQAMLQSQNTGGNQGMAGFGGNQGFGGKQRTGGMQGTGNNQQQGIVGNQRMSVNQDMGGGDWNGNSGGWNDSGFQSQAGWGNQGVQSGQGWGSWS